MEPKKKIVIFIDGYKFDVTEYANNHPGGRKILEKYNGKDATKAFNDVRGHCDGYVLGLLEEMEIKLGEKSRSIHHTHNMPDDKLPSMDDFTDPSELPSVEDFITEEEDKEE